MDAKSEEKPSSDGRERQQTEQEPSLSAVLSALSKTMGAQTELIAMLVSQQQALIELIAQQDEDEEDEPDTDMEGNPIRTR